MRTRCVQCGSLKAGASAAGGGVVAPYGFFLDASLKHGDEVA